MTLICQVRKSGLKQKVITIPINSEIQIGDYVYVEKLISEKEECKNI